MTAPDDDLLERALAGMLEEPEERGLAGRLKAEPALARRMMELAREEALLAEAVSERRALAAQAPRRPARPRFWIAGAAAALLLGLAALLLRPAGPDESDYTAEVVAAEGAIEARAGDRLGPGASLRTGPGAATLRYPDRTTLDLGPESEIALGRQGPSREVRLARGTLGAEVAKLPPGETLLFTTPHAEARVLGTRLARAVDGASTRLEVSEGQVLLSRSGGGAAVEVAAGQFAVTRPGREIVAAPRTGSGLRAEYFDNADLTGLKVTRVDPTVDFRWEKGAPAPPVGPETFSVRWTGRVLARSSETWLFHLRSDDGVRLWVDGKLLIDHWNEKGNTELAGAIALAAWHPVEIRLEYFDQGGPASVHLAWSSPSTPRQVVPREALFPALPGGSGLRAEYFDNEDFTNLRVTRVDPRVDFNWGLGAPFPSLDPDTFSVRWTGQVEPERSEEYTFHTFSDDGVRLWVDGKLLIDDWTVRGAAERSGSIRLEAGRKVALRLEYFDRVSVSRVALSWSSPGTPKDVIPQSRLTPPQGE